MDAQTYLATKLARLEEDYELLKAAVAHVPSPEAEPTPEPETEPEPELRDAPYAELTMDEKAQFLAKKYGGQ